VGNLPELVDKMITAGDGTGAMGDLFPEHGIDKVLVARVLVAQRRFAGKRLEH